MEKNISKFMEFLQSFGEILQVNYIFTYMNNAAIKRRLKLLLILQFHMSIKF
ncbi:TPA: hypothetical protein ACXDT3_002974 [Clostridioides difficile]